MDAWTLRQLALNIGLGLQRDLEAVGLTVDQVSQKWSDSPNAQRWLERICYGGATEDDLIAYWFAVTDQGLN